MLMQNQPYYIVTPYESGSRIKTSLLVLMFAGIASGIFIGACIWARSTARGISVAPVSICEPCGEVLDINGSSHCE